MRKKAFLSSPLLQGRRRPLSSKREASLLGEKEKSSVYFRREVGYPLSFSLPP